MYEEDFLRRICECGRVKISLEDLVWFIEASIKECPECRAVLETVLYRAKLVKADK